MLPLVSCIMPTGNRPHYMGEACSLFLDQDYPCRELLILDDGERAYAGAVPNRANILYRYEKNKRSIGAKLNELVELAAGEIILRWDDDDLSAPSRITRQVEQLVFNDADIAGYHSALFVNEKAELAWYYRGQPHYILGATQCFFRRAFGVPARIEHSGTALRPRVYPDSSVGEDLAFLDLFPAKRRHAIDAGSTFIARIHGGNTASHRSMIQQSAIAWPAALEVLRKEITSYAAESRVL